MSEPVDSLIFDSNNDIIYSAYSVGGVGQIRQGDPTVGISSDTLLATVGNEAVDLALVPGGDFVLGTSQATGKIYEVDLNNPGQTPVTFGSGQYTEASFTTVPAVCSPYPTQRSSSWIRRPLT